MTEKTVELPNHLKRRVVIDCVSPQVDGGRFAIKRLVGDGIVVEADIFCDGHEELDCRLHVRWGDTGQWSVVPMTCQGNDHWQASFTVDQIGLWHYTILARIDTFGTWLRDLRRRQAAGENLEIELLTGAQIVAATAHGALPAIAQEIEGLAFALRSPAWEQVVWGDRLRTLMSLHADERDATKLDQPRAVWVDRQRASWSAWYEVFPRSWGHKAGTHGTLRDLANRLESVSAMGFDVLYLTPIHPIGRTCRKGRNNSSVADSHDVGSPWAIGAAEGGHTALHPELGTFDDFEVLRSRAQFLGLELALDLAVQCSPDHPWITDHPEWFRHRSDGSIAYAENPPKKYQDIVPFDFQCDQWRQVWNALGDVVRFWVDKGVKIFRVDNPHTKPFAFWEWLIGDIHRTNPEVLFLAEAFTRPKTMYRLAKLGFTQSYTYFTWRTEKQELSDYLHEVTTPPISDFFRPAFWTNTPDILHKTLQEGGRPMFQVRLVLAALSVGNWGIYGPALELLAATPREPDSEEYIDSEKYELKVWDLSSADSLAPFITCLNQIRCNEPALFRNPPPRIQSIDDPQMLAWSKWDPASGSRVVVVVNLQPGCACSGRLSLDHAAIGLTGIDAVVAHDLLTSTDHLWQLASVTVDCTPQQPARVFRLTVPA